MACFAGALTTSLADPPAPIIPPPVQPASAAGRTAMAETTVSTDSTIRNSYFAFTNAADRYLGSVCYPPETFPH